MKSTKATVQQRVEEVLQLRLLGAEFTDIVRHASQAEWNVSGRQLWNYISAGDAILAKTLERDRAKLLDKHIAQRRALYARAMSVSDYGTARQVLKDEAELLNLYPAKRVEMGGQDNGPIILNIIEEIVGRESAECVPNIIEEIVTSDQCHRGQEDTTPPSPG